MRRNLVAAFCMALAMIYIVACGVDKKSENPLAVPDSPYIGGAWRIVLLPIQDTCSPGAGFTVYSPIDAPSVAQNGHNLSAGLLLGANPVILTGTVVSDYVVVVLEQVGVFIETLGGIIQGQTIAGTFNGQELPTGCNQRGVFTISIGAVDTPVITGEWTLTLRGTAVNCDDPADGGAFEKVIGPITATAPASGIVAAVYQDPTGVPNALGGIASGTSFAGGITDTVVPPTRVAMVNGTIYAASRTITGSLSGTLAFTGGNCDVTGGTFVVQY